MKILQKSFLEVEKDGKNIQLIVEQDVPLGALIDALIEMKAYCLQRLNEVHQEEQKELNQESEATEATEATE